jgi:FkbM family methyltransferase
MKPKRSLLLVKSWARLPLGIQFRIICFYLKKLIGLKARDHETIWTSFLYFSVPNVKHVESKDGYYLVEFVFEGKSLKTTIRSGRSTDLFAFFQVFIANGYKPLFDILKESGSPAIMVDAGANVGYFSLAATCCFNPALLIALEPEKGNYSQLRKNMEYAGLNSNLRLLECALWTEKRQLSIQRSSGGDWAMKVGEERTEEPCQAISLADIMNESKMPGIDILKIDVEGSEDVLFRNHDFLEGLKKVKVLGIEIHDALADRSMIQACLAERNFRFFEAGELTIGRNTNIT